MKILVIGSLNRDYVYKVENIAREGETVLSDSHEQFWGGKGLNQSVALAQAQADVTFACAVSENDREHISAMLCNYGLRDEYLWLTNVPTGHTMIQIDKNGQNCIVSYPGANYEITRAFIDGAVGRLDKGNYLLLQNETSNTEYIMRRGKEAGLKVVFNPSPINESILKLPLECVDLFVLNEIECSMLTGEANAEKMLDVMTAKFPHSKTVLTLGTQGSCYAHGEERIICPACKVKAVDTTGAGDTFTGYFLAEYLRGENAEQALHIASKAAAISVTVKGAVNAIPSLSDVKALD